MAAALGIGWTVVLAEDGALHACGKGDSGQLGLNNREDRLQPARVGGAELPGGVPVVLVAAGGSHSDSHWAASPPACDGCRSNHKHDARAPKHRQLQARRVQPVLRIAVP